MAYTIVQGVITEYTDTRICNVMQIPDHYLITNVRLPHTLQFQNRPLTKSIVLVASEDSFKSYIIAILRDPISFVSTAGQLKGTDGFSQFQTGEIFLEVAGDPSLETPGLGCTLHMSNDGTINLHSGKRKEYLTIGGTDSDDDGEVILRGDNGFFESNVSQLTQTQSAFRFDDSNNIQIVNNIVTVPPVGNPIEVPTVELKFDNLGTVTLRNTIAGVTKDLLEFTPAGQVTLKNQLGSYEISATGGITEQSTLSLSVSAGTSLSMSSITSTSISAGSTMSLSATGNMTLSGVTINMNSGTFGVARLNDIVTSNLTTDPTWWTFWSLLSTQIAALPTTPLDGGATLKAGLAALFATIPMTIISKITTASTTVKAGG